MKKKARASGRNVGKVFNPVFKLVLENYPFSEVKTELIYSKVTIWCESCDRLRVIA